ncbi:AMP-binding protein [Micromonospora sp. NPDC048868]|uniref:AMP-binding protein n=1 Tax=Micromonospora sp. NPDC048868 TaxID=3364258 RepID=UPI00371F6F00
MSGEHGGLLDRLHRHAAAEPERVAFTWLRDLGTPTDRLTYAELDEAASTVGARLRSGTEPGDRVLVVHPPGLGFLTGFLGCLYAGVVPVPVYPALDTSTGAETVRRIAEDCGATLAWTSDETLAQDAERALGMRTEWRAGTDRLPEPARPDPARPAFLQYTSGSTGTPKGVVVTHGNLAANLHSIARAFRHDRSAVVLSWLPAYHDMGLIGNLLHPLHAAIPAYLAAPGDFVRHPLSWLRAIADLGVTTSGAPNFAYELVVRAWGRAPVADLDLSGWCKAYSGAEPVSASTLERFAHLLSPAGFRRTAFIPCYGLAEATLLVTAMPPGQGARTRRAADGAEAVSCGRPYGCDVVVVAGDTPVADGTIGEVLVRGDSVAAGYWGQPELDGRVFGASVAGRTGRWLRTGDLGFFTEGELHVTGRSKDVIVIRGRNLYPHDLERLATSVVPALRPGGAVAFQDPAGRGVVMVAEARAGGVTDDDRRRLGAALASDFGVGLVDLLAVRPGTVPKTTSGKLRRGETARRYRAGAYERYRDRQGSAEADRSSPQGRTRRAVEELLGVPVTDETEPLVALGLDSLTALQLSELVHRESGADLPVRVLLEGATLADLLARVESPAAARPAEPAAAPAGHGRLSQAQEALAFLQTLDPDSDEYSISFAWELGPGTDVAAFDEALRLAVRRQPELAVRIVADGNRHRREPVSGEHLTAALALAPVPIRPDRLDEQLADAAAAPFRLDKGPLVRLYRWQSADRQVYQLVVHHIVTDLWSLGLLLRDLGEGYRRLSGDAGWSPPPRGSYDDYVNQQDTYLRSPAAEARSAALRRRLPKRATALDIRTDLPRANRRSARAGRVTRTLPVAADARGGPDQVALLVALWALCLHRYGTPSPVVVGVPVLGRPSGRLAEIGGLCTNTVPVAIGVDVEQQLDALVADVRQQVLDGMDEGLYPLLHAVQAVRPPRVAGRLPLLETLVTVLENPLPEVPELRDALSGQPAPLRLGELTMASIPVPRRTCRYDLDLVVTPRRSEYLLTLDYAVDLFRPDTAAAILATYAAMVAAAGTGPERVAEVFVLSETDEALVKRFAGMDRPDVETPVPARMRDAAVTWPDAPAVVAAGRTVRFEDFADQVDRLAAALRVVTGGDGSGERRPDEPA